jgi:hypothetical protein
MKCAERARMQLYKHAEPQLMHPPHMRTASIARLRFEMPVYFFLLLLSKYMPVLLMLHVIYLLSLELMRVAGVRGQTYPQGFGRPSHAYGPLFSSSLSLLVCGTCKCDV